MKFCPDCGHRGGCYDSHRELLGRRRRYRCPKCNRRWSTYEVPEELIDKYKMLRSRAPDRFMELKEISKAIEKLLAEEMSCD